MPPALDADVTVIGGGVVGLAVAAELAAGVAVILLERHPRPGQETSSRNSEVIHAGLYYPEGSLKARLCVRGNRLLHDFCAERGVACRRPGKLVIATADEEVAELERLERLGSANGAPGLRLLARAEVRALEPQVRAEAALLSPSTGIIDSHGLVKALEAEARGRGAQILYRAAVVAIAPGPDGFEVVLENPTGQERLRSRLLVNAAGLESDRVAAMAGVSGHRLSWCKGDYFALSGSGLAVSHLIYPVPAPGLTSLGVHLTLDLAGRMRLGPDATYVARAPTYDVDPAKAGAFLAAARRFLPTLALEHLQPDTAGIRPKLQGPGEPWRDFVIQEEGAAGLPGLVDLVGIESPGLTACLAIAEEVRRLLGAAL